MTLIGDTAARLPHDQSVAKRRDEYARVAKAVELKCHLLAEGVRVGTMSASEGARVNLTRRHLYDYGVARPGHEIPYEIVLFRVPSLGGKPIVARVRYNPCSAWELLVDDDRHILRHSSGETCIVEVPHITDFRGYTIRGIPLPNLVQRLGYDLLGLVPTNHCSYYQNDGKCGFCEIVETFQDERQPGTPFRRPPRLLVDATEVAADLDDGITAVTYNGGQLASHDATVRMYIGIVSELRKRAATSTLDTTIACMPPDDLNLLERLAETGLNQLFINVETMRRDLLPVLAPSKNKRGLDYMLEAMSRAMRHFGTGRVYSNLVYGVQAVESIGVDRQLNAPEENARALQGIRELLDHDIVPTFTVYHSSGRNQTGTILLSGVGLYELTNQYGQDVWQSGLIERQREAVLFSIGSLPNTTYNDGWLLAELRQRCIE